jgi:hypothetical protein
MIVEYAMVREDVCKYKAVLVLDQVLLTTRVGLEVSGVQDSLWM